MDLLQSQLDAHLQEVEDQQPLANRLAKARSHALRLHGYQTQLQRDITAAQQKLQGLQEDLDNTCRALRAAQSAVAELAAQQPPIPVSPFAAATPAATPAAAPPATPPAADTTTANLQFLLSTLQAHVADLPAAVQESVARMGAQQPSPPVSGDQRTPPPPSQPGDEEMPPTQAGTQEASKRELEALAAGVVPPKQRRVGDTCS